MEVNPLGLWAPLGRQPEKVVAPVETRAVRKTGVTSGSSSRSSSMAGGRLSADNPNELLFSGINFILPLSDDDHFRRENFSTRYLNRLTTARLMELLANHSPDVSRALWDFILLCCPGYEITAYKQDGKTADSTGQEALDAFLNNLHGPYTSTNVIPAKVVIGSMFMCAFLRGAVCAELVLDGSGRMPLEIATPDPAFIRFKRENDPDRGVVWQMGQWQLGQFVALDRPTIGYVPVHPFPGRPEGRAIATPAVFTTIFLLGMLHDLRRVIAQQGYPRHDIVIMMDKLRATMPEEDQEDPAKIKEWVDAAIANVTRFYSNLPPDAAFVHTDDVEMQDPKGVMDSKSLGAVDGIIKALERMSVRALKSFPLMFGINEAVSETHANRQWEIFAAAIKSIQQLVETLLQRLLGLALQVQGISSTVEVKMAELRAAELLRDSQVELLQIAIAARKRDEGWWTQDEASNAVVGHDAVGDPVATLAPLSGSGDLMGVQADPGSGK